MNIKEAKTEIKHTVKAYLQKDDLGEYAIPSIRQRPILLMGPPGIGKTQIMEQIARECRIGLVSYTITHHTRQSAVGLPYIVEETFQGKTYSVTEYTMSEIIASVYGEMERTGRKEGILFIDEINCVSETLAPTMLQFLQCKTFGNQKVPEGWIIVAAGNPPEYNKSVRELDMVTLDRVRRIDVTADYKVWKEYARENDFHSGLLSYLELRPKNFYRVESDVDGLRFVTARGWEDLSSLLKVYKKLQIPVDSQVIYEYLRQEDVAEDVAAYLELYEKYQDDYGISDILQGQVSSQVYARLSRASFDEKISVVNMLLDGLFLLVDEYKRAKEKTDDWYGFLKEYRSQIEKSASAKTAYKTLWEKYHDTFLQEKARKQYTPAQAKEREELLGEIYRFCPEAGEPKECFAQAKRGFDSQRERMEQKKKNAGICMENAFDFMESAFQTGEEMILFVTEMTLYGPCVLFLQSYSCERYIQYNKQLLMGQKRQELLWELEEHQ